MELTEKTVEQNTLFKGAIVTLRRDKARLPDGQIVGREVVVHPGAVVVLPLHEDGTVSVVRQFRYPLEQVLCELPAGKLEPGEDPRLAALRELEEEVGAKAGKLTELGAIYSSPGFCNEVLHLYLAQELVMGACHPDADEFLEPDRVPFDTLVKQIMDGVICDGKTVALVLKAKQFLGL